MSQFKNVAVVGLGLIGGTMVKTIKTKTDCKVFGYNRTPAVCEKAVEEGFLDGILTDDSKEDSGNGPAEAFDAGIENTSSLGEMDLVILGLYPDACIEYVKKNLSKFKRGAAIVDCCGTKRKICDALTKVCEDEGLHFIGGHPMAGIEKSGYDAAYVGIFDNASMILCKPDDMQVHGEVFRELKDFFLSLGFGFIKETNPEEHDRVIAYTSQMAHVVSNAYIKNETCKIRYGFSAGSFKDLTRVAYLNETMWTELFLDNREPLLEELKELMGHLEEYYGALENKDGEKLCKLLKEGRICKENDIASEEQQKKSRENKPEE